MKNIDTVINLLRSVSDTVMDLKTINLSDRKNFQLAYVTAERAKWRENIRKIVTDLLEIKLDVFDSNYPSTSSDDNNEISLEKEYKKCLAKLQPNINAYGMLETKESDSYYEKDGHIQNIIKRNNIKDIGQLIDYLSLLLKFDWQRSKTEAQSVDINNQQSDKTIEATDDQKIYITFVKKYEEKNPLENDT